MRATFRRSWPLLCCVSVSLAASAEMSAEEQQRRAQAVAKAGARQVTVGELEDRLAAMPQHARELFGATPDEVREGVLKRVLLRQHLLAAAAEANAPDPLLRYELTRARAGASLREIAKRAPTPAAFSAEQVQAYYDTHIDQYRAPLRVYVWRMLLPSRAAATAAIEQLGPGATPEAWAALCREQSLDEATKLRRGTLGFLAPDGSSSEAGVRVAPEIYQAAAKLEDGQLAAEPVAEGEHFAVIWRRGSTKEKQISVAQAETEIRRQLSEQAFQEARDAELARLRKQHLTQHHPERVAGIKLPVIDSVVLDRATVKP